MSTVESKLILSAEDRATATLAKIERATRGSAKALSQYEAAGKASVEVQRLTDALERNQRALGDTRAYDRARASHASAQASYKMARQSVERYERALASAKAEAKEFASVRTAQATAEMTAKAGKAAAAVADLTEKHRAADRVMRAAETTLRAEARTLESARRAMNEYGVPVRSVTDHQQALTRSIEATTAAIRKQNAAEAAAVTAAAAGGARRVVPALGSAPHPAAAVHPRLAVGLPAGSVSGLAGAGAGYGAYAGLKKAATSSIDFERAMIDVGKATDTSGKDLEAYGERLMKLARETGQTKESLAGIMASAGFAGRPKEELSAFTEYTAKAVGAWKMPAEEAGQALAELGNIYGANQKRIEEVGDAINFVADSSASREKDLVEFLRRAGASAKEAGISAENTLAFGATMKEVGVQTDVAATGFEALLNVMKLGKEFSKDAEDGLKALGIESTKMRKAFVAKPVETMIDLLEKLKNVSDPLQKAEILTNLFGKEYQDDIAKMLNSLDKLKEYIGKTNDRAAISAKGVRAEFDKLKDLDVMKLDKATQSLDALMRRIGDPIKVQAGSIAERINTMVEKIESGDTALGRIAKTVAESAGLKPADAKAEKSAWDDPVGAASTWLIERLDPRFGKSDAARTAIGQQEALDRPGQIERQIAEKRKWLDDGRKARASGGRSVIDGKEEFTEAQIKRLEGELAQARAAVSGVLLQRSRTAQGGQVGSGLVNFGLGGPALEQKAAEAAHTLGEGFQRAMQANPLKAESYLADLPATGRKKGEETGQNTGEGIRRGLRAKRPELEDESRFIFEGLRAIFGRGIRIPIGFEPGGGYGGGGYGGGIQKASFDPSAGLPFRRGAGSAAPIGARAAGIGDPYAGERAAPSGAAPINAFGGTDPIGLPSDQGSSAARHDVSGVVASLGRAVAGAEPAFAARRDVMGGASALGKAIGEGAGAEPGADAGRLNARAPEAAGLHRPQYALSDADLDQRVVNTIAGEVSTRSPEGVDAVINNMLNRVGSKGWGPSANLLQVARAPGQYAGYRRANVAETEFVRSRIRAIASGGVPDNTGGSNSYRAEYYYRQTMGRGKGFWAGRAAMGPNVGGNRYAFEKGFPNGPYAPYDPSGVVARSGALPFDRKASDAAMSMPGAPAGPGAFGLDGPKRVEIPEIKGLGAAGSPGFGGGSTSSTTNNFGGLTINAAPGQSPQDIAREVKRELSAELRSRRDGAYHDGVA